MSQQDQIAQLEPIDIQCHLWKAGISQKDLARRAKVSEMTISKVVRFEMVSERIFKLVADAIGMDHRQVFAWYYGPNNTKKRRIRRRPE